MDRRRGPYHRWMDVPEGLSRFCWWCVCCVFSSHYYVPCVNLFGARDISVALHLFGDHCTVRWVSRGHTGGGKHSFFPFFLYFFFTPPSSRGACWCTSKSPFELFRWFFSTSRGLNVAPRHDDAQLGTPCVETVASDQRADIGVVVLLDSGG